MSDDVVTRARKKVQRAIEQAEVERKNQMLQKRIEMAITGVRAYEKGHLKEAIQYFLGYLQILETWKGVGPNGLTPAMFDQKKDIYELLLISAIYWDLAKFYDQAKTSDKYAQFQKYMEKYILFSKGMPFQPLTAETLRKYIANKKPIHKQEFKNAYRVIGKASRCFVAGALVDELPESTIPRLRNFRDRFLRRFSLGRWFILQYYGHGRSLASGIARMPRIFRILLAVGIQVIATGAHIIMKLKLPSHSGDVDVAR